MYKTSRPKSYLELSHRLKCKTTIIRGSNKFKINQKSMDKVYDARRPSWGYGPQVYDGLVTHPHGVPNPCQSSGKGRAGATLVRRVTTGDGSDGGAMARVDRKLVGLMRMAEKGKKMKKKVAVHIHSATMLNILLG